VRYQGSLLFSTRNISDYGHLVGVESVERGGDPKQDDRKMGGGIVGMEKSDTSAYLLFGGVMFHPVIVQGPVSSEESS